MGAQKLLIVDDSPDIHELVRIWLADEPLEFFSCATGEEGLDLAPKLRPDLLLLDVDLPGLDGFEVCRRLKENPLTSQIPIVFLTGASSTEEKLRGLELGAIDYVTKPFDPAELRARARAALNTRKLMGLLAEKAITLQESEERFRVLAENSSDVISRHRPDGACMYVSPAATAILGYTPEQLTGRQFIEFVHPDDSAAMKRFYATAAPGGPGAISFRFLRGDHRYTWLESTCRALTNAADGTIREIHASARDISVRKQMEHREEVRADVLEMIAQGRPLDAILRRLIEAAERQEPDATAAGVMLTSGLVHHCAPHLPASIAACIEKHLYSLISRFTARAATCEERVVLCDLRTDPAWEDIRPAIKEHGLRSSWSVLICSRRRDACGVFSLYRCDDNRPDAAAVEMLKLAGDLTAIAVETRQLADQLSFQACHDSLTQLPNRALFSDHLSQAMANSGRTGSAVGVLLLDVDRFKHVNDTYGHQAGDEALCQVAHRLRSRLRASDVLARMGGDEFAAILSNLASPDDAQRVADSLVREFHEPVVLMGRKQFITVSAGTAVYPRDASDAVALMKCADLALYKAKDAGRNTVRSYTLDMCEGTAGMLELEGELRHAVRNGQFRLYYQPKVNGQGRIVGLEALIRWQHPRLGLVPPAKFVTLAEDTGLIIPIGTWVIEQAVRQSRSWIAAGLGRLPISVNVAGLQFAQPDFISVVSNTLEMAGPAEPSLEIELTETSLMCNIRDAREKLAQLRNLNVSIAIDDFGTGYSSLAYLQRLSLNILKIDRSFVSAIDGEPVASNDADSGKIIVRAIVALAKGLGLQVVAEGVETTVQRDFLVEIGCDQLQGYLFSPPHTAETIESLLRRQLEGESSPLTRCA